MTSAALFPARGRHAVVSAGFAITFDSELNAERIEELGKAAEAFKGRYPKREVVQSMTFQLAFNGERSAATPERAGWNVLVPIQEQPDFIDYPFVRACSAQANKFNAVENDYERWANFEDNVLFALDVWGDLLSRGRQVKSINLQYTDGFIWKDSPETLSMDGVLRAGCRFVPANVFDIGASSFHSHTGFFNPHCPDYAEKLLDNINVQRGHSAKTGFDHVDIVTIHTVNPKEKSFDDGGLRNLAEQALSDLHQRNKKALSELLQDDVLDLIKLKV